MFGVFLVEKTAALRAMSTVGDLTALKPDLIALPLISSVVFIMRVRIGECIFTCGWMGVCVGISVHICIGASI